MQFLLFSFGLILHLWFVLLWIFISDINMGEMAIWVEIDSVLTYSMDKEAMLWQSSFDLLLS